MKRTCNVCDLPWLRIRNMQRYESRHQNYASVRENCVAALLRKTTGSTNTGSVLKFPVPCAERVVHGHVMLEQFAATSNLLRQL